MPPAILLTGCSGGGKSTLLAALADAGERVVAEPGRRVIAAERAAGGTALPWLDMPVFLRRAAALAISDLRAPAPMRRFFDRGLIDAAVALEHVTGIAAETVLADAPPYAVRVFVAPPWPELFARDAERRHDFAAAQAEYRRIVAALPRLGHEAIELPRIAVAARVAFVLDRSADLHFIPRP